MIIENAISYGKKYIHKNEVFLILSAITGIAPLELYVNLDKALTIDEENKFKNMVMAKKSGYPLQYILGSVNFLGYEFKVKEGVLIPRFETEELVTEALKYIESDKKVIDLGCGAGNIGISLKLKRPDLMVDMVDLNEDAIKLSKENAELLNANVYIYHEDMFEALNKEYDVYISNPPYLKDGEAEEDVVKYEPHTALFAEDNGLYYYKEILRKLIFKKGTLIAFEIGDGQGEDVKNIAKTYLENFEIKVIKDMQGRERIVIIQGI